MKNSYWEECLAKIDGTKETLEKALKEFIRVAKEDDKKVLKSQELFFYEEMSKTLLNWIGKGETRNINELYNILDNILLEDDELSQVMFKLNLRERIGAQLIMFSELIATFLSADLASKDNDVIFNNSKAHIKLREILVIFFIKNRTLNRSDVTEILKQKGDYQTTRTLQRDLDKLVEINFLNKRQKNSKIISYALSARAYHYKDKIMQMQEAGNSHIANFLEEYSGSQTDSKDFRIQAGNIFEIPNDSATSKNNNNSTDQNAKNTGSVMAPNQAAQYLTLDFSEIKKDMTKTSGKKDLFPRLKLSSH